MHTALKNNAPFALMPLGNSERGSNAENTGCPWLNPKGIASFSPGLLSLRGYPGFIRPMFANPEGVGANRGEDATPLGLINLLSIPLPRVVRSSQPWAERLNPVGIPNWNFRKANEEKTSYAKF